MGIIHLKKIKDFLKKEKDFVTKGKIRRKLNINDRMLTECLTYFLSEKSIEKRTNPDNNFIEYRWIGN